MTNDIHRQQLFIFTPEKTMQPCHLTGCAGKQHFPPLFQKSRHLLITVAHIRLHIFASPKCRKPGYRIAIIMNDFPMRIKPCSKHHTSISNNLFCKHGEYPAGRRLTAYDFIGIDRSINLAWTLRLQGVQLRAHFFTQSAIYANRLVNGRIEETLLILMHGNTVFRTH